MDNRGGDGLADGPIVVPVEQSPEGSGAQNRRDILGVPGYKADGVAHAGM